MEWLAPIVLIPATAVVLVMCTRAVMKALREEKGRDQKLGSVPEKQD